MQLKASAPGSLMLLGEFAVLYGKQAVVCAVDKRITVTMTPRADNLVKIQSNIGSYETNINSLKPEKPFQFVLGVFKQYQSLLRNGFDISIDSNFSHQIGLGSSAAVTVATLAALLKWLNTRTSPLDLVRQGRNIIRQVQGAGSGADIAASVYGGIVMYQNQPLSAEKFSFQYPLSALYAGFKTPTPEVIKRVQNYFASHPDLFRILNNTIGQCVIEGIQLLRKQNWQKLGEMFNVQQGLMESLGVSTSLLREMITDLRQQPDILGAKISGSGMGDCVIGLGSLPNDYQFSGKNVHVQCIPVSMSLQGVHCEKI